MNSAKGTRHDNKAEQEFKDRGRAIKLVSRNEGNKTGRALRIGISDDLFSARSDPNDSFPISNEVAARETSEANSVPNANLLDIKSERPRSVEGLKMVIYLAAGAGLIVGFLIGRRL